MRPRFRYTGTILLAIATALALTFTLVLLLRGSGMRAFGFTLYLGTPLVLLPWSILRYVRKRKNLFLVFSIALTVFMAIFFGLLFIVILAALKSFT